MEPLYSVKTALTEEEFVRFSRFVAHSNKKNLTIIIVCGVIILAFAIEHFVTGTNIPAAIGLLAGMLVCVWLFTFGVDRTAKRYYRQYVVKEGSEQTILFFDDRKKALSRPSFSSTTTTSNRLPTQMPTSPTNS